MEVMFEEQNDINETLTHTYPTDKETCLLVRFFRSLSWITNLIKTHAEQNIPLLKDAKKMKLVQFNIKKSQDH